MKEEDAKIQAESDARAKAINDAREKVRQEQGGAPATSSPVTSGNRKPHQAPRQNSHSNANANGTAGNGNGPSRPNNKGGRTNSSNQNQKTDDGFEVAKSSRRDNRDRDQSQQQQQSAAVPPTKKDAPIRQGFSFAAAAGLVDESTESKDEASTGEVDEEVTKSLSEVKV